MTPLGQQNQEPEGPIETVKDLFIIAGGITVLIALYIAHARISFYLLP
jgi:hypothetical protein